MGFDLTSFMIGLPCVILALSLHEFGHAAMADKLGDPTPRLQGRVTLNPLAHLDPLGTLFIIMTMLSGFGFGWGKPVLTNPAYYQNYRQGVLLVAAAGPLMNMCLAMLAIGGAFLIFQTGGILAPIAMRLLSTWIIINMVLAIFNLIPIPPLDGGNIVASLLPGRIGERYRFFAPYGMLILMGMMFFGLTSLFIGIMVAINQFLLGELLGHNFVDWLFGGW